MEQEAKVENKNKGIIWLIAIVIIALVVIALTTKNDDTLPQEETSITETLIDENASDEIQAIEQDLGSDLDFSDLDQDLESLETL